MKKIILALLSAVLAGACYGEPMSNGIIKIGLLTDMAGPYADVDGVGGWEAVKMAAADMGGNINGAKIEVLAADHMNRPDIAASKAREWFETQNLDMLIGGTNSAVNMALAKIAQTERKPFISVGSVSTGLTNTGCTPYTVHYAVDTTAFTRSAATGIVKQGGKKWFFLTANYPYGASVESSTSMAVRANGGTVVGSTRHPVGSHDLTFYLSDAQSSDAQVLALANTGIDTMNAIKAASKLGINKSMKLVGTLLFEPDIQSLGLEVTQGMYFVGAWYWDMNPESRAFAQRFYAIRDAEPTYLQAADYSATMTYLKAVKAVGSTDADKVMAQMKATEINDMFTKHGVIRPDGRMVHDMYLMQVKTPDESKGSWDYFTIIQTIPGDQAFGTKSESLCPLWK